MAPLRVILDTDIGSNVDDALALAVLLGSPDVELVGCTTVYGDTLLRAWLAKRLLRLAGRRAPVVPGQETTLAGRAAWWAGHEGALFDDLAHEAVDDEVDAAGFLTRGVAAAPGQVDVVAIGPLTNLARAVRADPAFHRRVRHVWIMGGRFDGGGAEHNIASDPEAAAVVLASGAPTTVTGMEITTTIRFGAREAEVIEAAGELGRALAAEMRQWWQFRATDSSSPHDAITALTMLEPHLFTFSPYGTVTVTPAGETVFTSKAAPGEGSVRITVGIDTARVTAEILRRLRAAARRTD